MKSSVRISTPLAKDASGKVVRTSVLSALYGHHVEVLHVGGRVLVVAGLGTNEDHCLPVETPREVS